MYHRCLHGRRRSVSRRPDSHSSVKNFSLGVKTSSHWRSSFFHYQPQQKVILLEAFVCPWGGGLPLKGGSALKGVCLPLPILTSSGGHCIGRSASYWKAFLFSCKHFAKQECIPVGCIPSAAVAISGGGCLPRGCRGCLPRGRVVSA